MNRFNSFLEDFCSYYEYPREATEAFASLFARFDAEEHFGSTFEDLRGRYLSYHAGIYDLLEPLHQLADEMGVPKETMDFVFLLSLTEDLLEKYRFIGMPDEIYYETMADLKYKLNECLINRHVPGTFVTWWFDGYFRLTRFAFGRFQYETHRVRIYRKDGPRYYVMPSGKVIHEGDLFLNFHIPSSGEPLTDAVRYDSYKKAWEHLKGVFPDGEVLFGCHTWLLYPKMQEFLPEHMNLLKFQKDFCLVDSEEDPTFHDAWRLYGPDCDKKPEDLPRDTTLRRAVADWLMDGKLMGTALGFFFFDGEKITH